jgi:hypothetical protein
MSKFTESQITYMVDQYAANTPIPAIAKALSSESLLVKPRSVITKLALLGLYRKPVKLTKSGTPVTSKDDIIASISEITGLAFIGLKKADKSDLTKILDYLKQTPGHP